MCLLPSLQRTSSIENDSSRMDFNLTANNHNDTSYIAFLKEILNEAARDQDS